LWNVGTGKLLRELPLRANVFYGRNSLVFNHDGRSLLRASSDRTLALWDIATGKEIRDVYTAPAGMSIDSFLASSNGEHLVVELSMALPVRREEAHLAIHQLHLWDLTQGKLVRIFQKASYHKRVGDGAYFGRLAISPDGKTVAAADQSGTIVLWDVANGKIIREIPSPDREWAVSALAFSPDSKCLLSSDCRSYVRFTHGKPGISLRIRDVATGKECFCISNPGEGVLAMSPDGRTFALSDGSPSFRIYEYLTGQELLQVKAKGDHLTDLAFLPDGKTLASVTNVEVKEDFVLIWDLNPADWRPPSAPLSATNFLALWQTLADNDAAKAYRAVLSLSSQPAQSIRFLKDHLARIPSATQKRMQQLIADLDNDDFQQREAASRELMHLGSHVESALRQALAHSPSLEVRRRIDALLQDLNQWAIKSPELLRCIRAIWVLQRIGTPEARAVLESLATGSSVARQTQEAKAALQFLDRIQARERKKGDSPK